jgi:hypothetical protein
VKEVADKNCRTQAYLAEVANSMTSLGVPDCHYVKEKGFHVVVQCFVVQKELGQEAEVLTILLVALAIHFPN